MKKIIPTRNRWIVTSRGTKEDVEGIVLPETVLRDSNVCTTEDGRTIICRDMMGYDLGDGRKIILEEDILAFINNEMIEPVSGWLLTRKCLDPEDESGVIVSQTRNRNQWVEILSVSEDSRLSEDIGNFAYVNKTDSDMQKVEETDADWLIKESSLIMIAEPEE